VAAAWHGAPPARGGVREAPGRRRGAQRRTGFLLANDSSGLAFPGVLLQLAATAGVVRDEGVERRRPELANHGASSPVLGSALRWSSGRRRPFPWRGTEQRKRRLTRPRLLLAATGTAARLPDARAGGHPWLLAALLLLLSGGGGLGFSPGGGGHREKGARRRLYGGASARVWRARAVGMRRGARGLPSRRASSARGGARSGSGSQRAAVSHLPAYVTGKKMTSSG
jgi:hypothetical protein